MSRTGISAASLADYLRRKAGDGGIEWCYEPMQSSVLLDIADMLDENAKLRELVRDMHAVISDRNSWWDCMCKDTRRFADRMSELGVEVDA